MRISVSEVDDIDTSLPTGKECSNVSPNSSGTIDDFTLKELSDAIDVGNARTGAETGLWTGTGVAVSLTEDENLPPSSSATSTSSSKDHHRVTHNHYLDSGGTVDSTVECLNLSLEELRPHRVSFGKRVRTNSDDEEVWKKVRTVSLLHSSPTDLVSGFHVESADDEKSEVGDGGDDMDDEVERDEDDTGDVDVDIDKDGDGEAVEDEMDTSSSLSAPTVIVNGRTEQWRERQEKAMMLAGKLAALASASTSTSTSIAQQGSVLKDVSEESCTDDVSTGHATASQEEVEGEGQMQVQVQGNDSSDVLKALGKTKRGLERRRRRSKPGPHGNSLASIAHTISSSSSSSDSTGSTAESLPLSPSSAHSGTSNRTRGQKGKRDVPSKPDFRESKFLLSKCVTG